MTVQKLVQHCELKFWGVVITIMAESGFLMKITRFFSSIIHSKPASVILLFLIWAAIGFVSGLILGKIIWIFQLV